MTLVPSGQEMVLMPFSVLTVQLGPSLPSFPVQLATTNNMQPVPHRVQFGARM
jgi:hypothetical protein